MARDGNGTYSAPVNTWNPSINGVLATAGDWQQLLNDIVAALTQSVSRDGQTPMTGNLALGSNKITGLTAGFGTGEALAFQQLFNQGTQADIASAATTDIGVQNTNFLRVTGNTTITSFGTNYRGPRFLVFEQNITLTNSGTLVLPGGANISANAGDAAIVIPGATLGTPDKWIVIAYQSATNPSQIVTLNGTQTLTNKTLTNPVINGFTGSTAAINIGSGQLVKDTAGNLGLGVTPSAWASGRKAFQVSAGSGGAYLVSGGVSQAIVGANGYSDGATFRYVASGPASVYEQNGGAHLWYTAPSGTAGNAISLAECARIDSSGNFIFNKTTTGDGTVGSYISTGGTVSTTRAESTNATLNYVLYSTGAGNYRFYVGMGGTIYATSTSISAISDRTLKENIRDLETGLTEVMALKPRRFDWKNGDAQNVAGFVAQEVEEVLPELVTDYRYNTGEDGNDIIKKSLKMGDILPTLVAAIQEQQALIQTLTARVAALESN